MHAFLLSTVLLSSVLCSQQFSNEEVAMNAFAAARIDCTKRCIRPDKESQMRNCFQLLQSTGIANSPISESKKWSYDAFVYAEPNCDGRHTFKVWAENIEATLPGEPTNHTERSDTGTEFHKCARHCGLFPETCVTGDKPAYEFDQYGDDAEKITLFGGCLQRVSIFTTNSNEKPVTFKFGSRPDERWFVKEINGVPAVVHERQ